MLVEVWLYQRGKQTEAWKKFGLAINSKIEES